MCGTRTSPRPRRTLKGRGTRSTTPSRWRAARQNFRARRSQARRRASGRRFRIWRRGVGGLLSLDVRRLEDRPPLVDLGLVVGAQRFGGLLLARENLLRKIGE